MGSSGIVIAEKLKSSTIIYYTKNKLYIEISTYAKVLLTKIFVFLSPKTSTTTFFKFGIQFS